VFQAARNKDGCAKRGEGFAKRIEAARAAAHDQNGDNSRRRNWNFARAGDADQMMEQVRAWLKSNMAHSKATRRASRTTRRGSIRTTMSGGKRTPPRSACVRPF